MKRIIQTLVMSVCSLLAFGQTEEYMVLEQADGTVLKLNINDVVRITFESGSPYQTDESFYPEVSYIQGTWLGEYEGWDWLQQVNSKIRRRLVLYPDGRYENLIQGVLPMAGHDSYVDFEREKGTYNYSVPTRTLTYLVETDSLLDFRTQQFVGYTNKHYYDHAEDEYTETPQFTQETEGRRKWLTYDNSLLSPEDKKSPLMYSMDKQDEESKMKNPQ